MVANVRAQTSRDGKTKSAPGHSAYFDEGFYEIDRSLGSARIYLKYLFRVFQPQSVLDVGCGRGAWLKACHELGAKELLGFDGEWNTQSLMIDDAIKFQGIDLGKPFTVRHKVDLTITVEVAEHLEPEVAPQFVRCLTECSDVILFSAAFVNQGGTNHVNERPHSYWASLFAVHDFHPFDLFRPTFWGNENVAYWYRQNVFLYVRRDSSVWRLLANSGHRNMADISFMNCIHPESLGLTSLLAALYPSVVKAIRKRLFLVKK
jgi:SAM-dependent methyltransferase